MNRDIKPYDYVGIWSEEEGYSFIVPEGVTDKTDIPDPGTALISAMLRLEYDAIFRQECIDWLKRMSKKRS